MTKEKFSPKPTPKCDLQAAQTEKWKVLWCRFWSELLGSEFIESILAVGFGVSFCFVILTDPKGLVPLATFAPAIDGWSVCACSSLANTLAIRGDWNVWICRSLANTPAITGDWNVCSCRMLAKALANDIMNKEKMNCLWTDAAVRQQLNFAFGEGQTARRTWAIECWSLFAGANVGNGTVPLISVQGKKTFTGTDICLWNKLTFCQKL